ncbi:hypothetical protein RGU70_05685 [Herbaspirillum sp. RTI4]|uniref:hypothetical protein n=1 Tax=Herbaspirillum sp. RTI4 TaxID=3048640 RepID=UPI002AB4F299|nr:hypothetical protein [Herbaspirillum sp. RTI4]MDY7577809.1 hypothetical protein [Herbaspirillum sp. RTI4]MEA9983439.1 hypothetical protein [Herbaspirillum sp. RTI4]
MRNKQQAKQPGFIFAAAPFQRKSLCQLALVLLAASASYSSIAANPAQDENARYQNDLKVCNSGHSNQDRATCLKEAGAARDEAKRGRLNDRAPDYRQNALSRCQSLPMRDQEACQRRIDGDGTSSGSAQEGGMLRKLVEPDHK